MADAMGTYTVNILMEVVATNAIDAVEKFQLQAIKGGLDGYVFQVTDPVGGLYFVVRNEVLEPEAFASRYMVTPIDDVDFDDEDDDIDIDHPAPAPVEEETVVVSNTHL